MTVERDPPTDPGTRSEQKNQHVGMSGELVLPDVVDIVDVEHAGRFGKAVNRAWLALNFALRGIVGTGAEWFTFVVGAAAQYPKVSVVLVATCGATIEEKYAEEPIIGNTTRYIMQTLDPHAAEVIFAEPLENPVDDLAHQTAAQAVKDYAESPEYAQLKLEVEEAVRYQVRRELYRSAGMAEELRELEAEIASAHAERHEEHQEPVAQPSIEQAPPADEPPAVILGEQQEQVLH